MPRNITPEIITRLQPGAIFVFGSNIPGRHGKGAALTARMQFGAVPGKGVGPMGRSYAIPTKGGTRYGPLPVLPLSTIATHVREFLRYAESQPESCFLVTKLGCGEAGYSSREIAPLFAGAPVNVALPAEFIAVLRET